MPIILSQRIDLVSDYQDKPYFRYHFPKRYRNQVKRSDRSVFHKIDGRKLKADSISVVESFFGG